MRENYLLINWSVWGIRLKITRDGFERELHRQAWATPLVIGAIMRICDEAYAEYRRRG